MNNSYLEREELGLRCESVRVANVSELKYVKEVVVKKARKEGETLVVKGGNSVAVSVAEI